MSALASSAPTRGCALVAGALGLVGARVLETLHAEGWQTIGVARAKAPSSARHQHLQLDLLDAAACREQLAAQSRRVTHAFFAARAGDPDPSEEVRLNLAMLTNLIDVLDHPGGALAHVNLVHGTKWYGSHLGPYTTPAREDDARCLAPLFYYAQQDEIVRRQQGKSWTWSAVRPHIVLGVASHSPYNCITLLGAYGSLCAAQGVPLAFPGSRAAFESVSQATDAGLLARAMIWCATSAGAANHAYNVINGDYFRWRNVWPRLAEFFGVAPGPVRPMSLQRDLGGASPLWDAIVADHGLQPVPLKQLANWQFGDFLFGAGWDDMSSTVKLRQRGFHEALATEEVMLGHLAAMRASRLIP